MQDPFLSPTIQDHVRCQTGALQLEAQRLLDRALILSKERAEDHQHQPPQAGGTDAAAKAGVRR